MPTEEIKNDSLTADSAPLTAAEAAPESTAKPPKRNWRKFFSRKKTGSLDVFKIIKYIYPLTIFIIILILTWVMLFLYNNVYLTMTQAEIVSGLKAKVIEESVDFSQFSAIVQKIADKKGLADWPYLDYLSNPFAYGARTSYPAGGATLPPALPAEAENQTGSTTPNQATTTE